MHRAAWRARNNHPPHEMTRLEACANIKEAAHSNPFGAARGFQLDLGVEAQQRRHQICRRKICGAKISADRRYLSDSWICRIARGQRQCPAVRYRGKLAGKFGVGDAGADAYLAIVDSELSQCLNLRNRDIKGFMLFLAQRGAHDPGCSRERSALRPPIAQRGDSVMHSSRDIEPSLGCRGQTQSPPSGPISLSVIPAGFATAALSHRAQDTRRWRVYPGAGGF